MSAHERRDDATSTAGASTDQHVTGSEETGAFLTDELPTSATPAHGSSNAGINAHRANRPDADLGAERGTADADEFGAERGAADADDSAGERTASGPADSGAERTASDAAERDTRPE